MGFYSKGTDGIPITAKNPLENSIGNISLNTISAQNIQTNGYLYANGAPVIFGSNYGNSNVIALMATFGSNPITTTGNIAAGILTGNGAGITGMTTSQLTNDSGYITTATANVISVNGQTGTVTIATGGGSAANVTYTETTPGDWTQPVANVQSALDVLANTVTNIETGAGFTFLGPFSNDAQASAGGVALGQVYFNASGGLVVRQT